MPISDIVQVTIAQENAQVTQRGFGTPLIVDYHTVFPELTRTYTAVADAISDGFAADSAVVRALTAVFAQATRPPEAVVGRLGTASTMTVLVTVTNVINTFEYSVSINGTEFTFTSDATATDTEIATGLVTAINLGAEPVTAVDNADGTFTLTADVAGDLFDLVASNAYYDIENQTTDAGIVADLTAIQAENDNWYCLLPCSSGAAEIAALAASIEAQKKIMLAVSADSDIYGAGAGDLGTTLQTAGYARTALIWHQRPGQYANAAWAGANLSADPGSVTWKFVELAGVDASDITATEKTNLEGKNVNHYRTIGGIAITQQGVMAGGDFIDITRGIDWLQARIEENVFALLASRPKVPGTDDGIAQIEAVILGVLAQAVDREVLAANPAPETTVPVNADRSSADRANRILRDVEFTGTLAGAIHEVIISGKVSV